MRDKLDYDSISSALLVDELQRKVNLGSSSGRVEGEAHMTRCGSFDWGGKKISFKGKSSARSKSNGHENKYVCRSCGETGHLKEDCKKRGKKNSEKGKETKNSNEVNQVEVFSSSGVEEELLMAGYSSEYHQNWVVMSSLRQEEKKDDDVEDVIKDSLKLQAQPPNVPNGEVVDDGDVQDDDEVEEGFEDVDEMLKQGGEPENGEDP
ncbi:hypothetical protein Dimus_030504 [Dionaea muscipula]